MKIGYFILNSELREDPRVASLIEDLESATYEVYEIRTKADVRPETDLVLSMGGDGTFLSTAHVVADIGLPILGVNFGRIGFLCENRPEAVKKALMEGEFRIEYRTVLNATLKGPEARRSIGMLPYSVNEVALHRSGSSVLGIHVAINGEYAGHIVINDMIKDDSAEAIRQLKALGVERTVILTGDRQEVADHVAKALGITEYHAELLPADKVSFVEKELTSQSSKVAFVGDGINDAPVLARADIGIAMGGLGSDAAIEAADVVLMDDQPSKIAQAIRIARRTLSIARQNVWFAIGVKIAVLILATFGLSTMWMAVFADVGVTVLAVLNAMRTMY